MAEVLAVQRSRGHLLGRLVRFGAYAFGEKATAIASPFAAAMAITAIIVLAVGMFYLRRHEQELQQRVERMFPGPLRH